MPDALAPDLFGNVPPGMSQLLLLWEFSDRSFRISTRPLRCAVLPWLFIGLRVEGVTISSGFMSPFWFDGLALRAAAGAGFCFCFC